MKVVLLAIALLLASTAVPAQQNSAEWERVYTFDDSLIEMNTATAVFGGDIARVKFRWTFDQPEMLSRQSSLMYKSKLEAFEINCVDKRYRPLAVTFSDSAGKVISHEDMYPLGEWHNVWGFLMERMVDSACGLKKRETQLESVSLKELESQKAAKYAFSLSQQLEKTRDVKPIIEKYFVNDYLKRYLRDQKSNWFWNLNRETAAKASRDELERFYVAVLNAGYLGGLYFSNQAENAADSQLPEKSLIPADVLKFIEGHPYTAKYKGQQINHNYLAEKLDSVERLRSYTKLLEGINALLRRHVIKIATEHPEQFQAMMEDWDLYSPTQRTCETECLGLPKGTKLFEVNVPVFHLQLAEIKGQLRVVSATEYFH